MIEWWRGVRRTTKGREREIQNLMSIQLESRREHSEAHADKELLTCKWPQPKLFVHDESKQQTNQSQKSMSTEITANHCHSKKCKHNNEHLWRCIVKTSSNLLASWRKLLFTITLGVCPMAVIDIWGISLNLKALRKVIIHI